MSSRLGDLLINRGHLTGDQLGEAIRVQREKGGKLGSVLVRLGLVSDQVIASLLSEQYGLPPIDVSAIDIDAQCLNLIPLARRWPASPGSSVAGPCTCSPWATSRR